VRGKGIGWGRSQGMKKKTYLSGIEERKPIDWFRQGWD